MLRRLPLIVILGSTGTGKTRLSLELAERFNGEVISADSMQVYANLDIVTAKATKEERERVRHHMLDVTSPTEPYTVLNFRHAALPIIDDLLGHRKMPIIVGGTNYYIESLLWHVLAGNAVDRQQRDESLLPNTPHLSEAEMRAMSSLQLHHHLKQIDPATANRLHPNNRRKIESALLFYERTGSTLTACLSEQRALPGGNRHGGPLRYNHIILFWLRCRQDVLNTRLDKRVDGMLKQGLLCEVRAFYDANKPHIRPMASDGDAGNNNPSTSPYTKGILQTIGFKEFIPYLEQFDVANDRLIDEYLRAHDYRMPQAIEFKNARRSNKNTTRSECGSDDSFTGTEKNLDSTSCEAAEAFPPGLEELSGCLDELKLVTRRYSKKQIKWIMNRFLQSEDRQVPDIYELDTTHPENWHEAVYQRAESIVNSYMRNEECDIKPMMRLANPRAGMENEATFFCEKCQRTFVGEYQWSVHMQSNRHRRRKSTAAGRKRTNSGCTSDSSNTDENTP